MCIRDRFGYVYPGDDKHVKAAGPVSSHCDCPTCRRYSLGYLHHLFKLNDNLYFRLATVHLSLIHIFADRRRHCHHYDHHRRATAQEPVVSYLRRRVGAPGQGRMADNRPTGLHRPGAAAAGVGGGGAAGRAVAGANAGDAVELCPGRDGLPGGGYLWIGRAGTCLLYTSRCV